MKIIVDADACPVIKNIEKIAKSYEIKVVLLFDSHHQITSDYSEVICVEAGFDAVDFKIVCLTECDDIVVTQDYGVAAMVIDKCKYCIRQDGLVYNKDIIDQMLFDRHLAKRSRNSKRRFKYSKHAKRNIKDDVKFEQSLIKLIESL